MDQLLAVDWQSMFVPRVSLIEMALRGTITYFGLLVLLRVFRRGIGGVNMTDLLLIVLIADAAQNAMSAEYHSITEGAVLFGAIILWDYFLDWLAYRIPFVRRLVRPRALSLIKDGRLLKQNMRREMVTEEELMSQLREQGIDDVSQVASCYMEGDGRFSVVTKDKQSDGQNKQRRRPAGTAD